jgi:site-specific DNA-methyltransferase (adenine-specific)
MTWNVITAPNMDRRFGLPALPDECIDSIVTDPPAGISFMGKKWDSNKGGRDVWIDWLFTIMSQCYRVLKPGGHLLVWALPRTSHWTAFAIEDAQFEIRDIVHHHFGNGFPKSLDVSKAIDRAAGAERDVVGSVSKLESYGPNFVYGSGPDKGGSMDITAPATESAKQWEGWGTALKPATEHWILARKPIEKTVARNVLLYGTGALNIDACRIGTDEKLERQLGKSTMSASGWASTNRSAVAGKNGGRWPANLILSHGPDCEPVGTGHIRGDRRQGSQGSRPAGFVDTGAEAGDNKPSGPLYGDESVVLWNCAVGCPVAELDRQSGLAGGGIARSNADSGRTAISTRAHGSRKPNLTDSLATYGDIGGASRFFATFRYEAKPSRAERDAGLDAFEASTAGQATDRKDGSKGLGNPRAGAGRTGGAKNTHPTVKSVALMSWLVRIITPPGGVVLDPFCGSGPTGCAAVIEGFDFLGFELGEKHAALARARIKFWEEWEAEQAPLLKAAGVDEKTRFEQLDMTERLQAAAESQFLDSAEALLDQAAADSEQTITEDEPELTDAERALDAWDRAIGMSIYAQRIAEPDADLPHGLHELEQGES